MGFMVAAWMAIGGSILAYCLTDAECRGDFAGMPRYEQAGLVLFYLAMWPLLLVPTEDE